ncbi:TPA: hypothetical protein HA225_01285 [Candidatus Micrarchaeota archaeon]|nr:hypothetical protein [Candidatus Micrarchaeota archaeon]HIH30060.1 hypothetical protein [Candidatus Micrarchaeota archaeon]
MHTLPITLKQAKKFEKQAFKVQKQALALANSKENTSYFERRLISAEFTLLKTSEKLVEKVYPHFHKSREKSGARILLEEFVSLSKIANLVSKVGEDRELLSILNAKAERKSLFKGTRRATTIANLIHILHENIQDVHEHQSQFASSLVQVIENKIAGESARMRKLMNKNSAFREPADTREKKHRED